MANFRAARELWDLQQWVRVLVMNDYSLLMLVNEFTRRGRRNIAERTISNRCTRLCGGIVECKRINVLGLRE